MAQVQIKNCITNFLEYLELEKGRSQKTIRNYSFYLNRFCDWAKNPKPENITKDTIKRYRLWLNKAIPGRTNETLKKNTQNYHLIALRTLFKYLSKNDIACLQPEKIELSKQGTRNVSFLENEELDRMFSASSNSRSPDIVCLRDRAILELLFSTGLRVSELESLHIDGVNLKNDEFTVRGKGDKTRVVFLSDEAKKAIHAYLQKRMDTSPFMFVSHDRAKNKRGTPGPLTARSIQRMVERCAKEGGVSKHITPHTMRHTFATDLLRNGADIRSVQAMLGHSSITTTQIYTHVTDQQLRKVHKEHHGKKQKRD
ncbi:MAG: site-specific tyrosine recombinase XerC [uncultured bacterium]|nr:MAG: site-specific tyrosine recombinase XerC [uncultured bacterium]HBD04898.1 hypothetical protein [Candidatus Uhrbacteria bacterium]